MLSQHNIYVKVSVGKMFDFFTMFHNLSFTQTFEQIFDMHLQFLNIYMFNCLTLLHDFTNVSQYFYTYICSKK